MAWCSWKNRQRTNRTQAQQTLSDFWKQRAREMSDADLDKAVAETRDMVAQAEKALFYDARQWARNQESRERWSVRLSILMQEKQRRSGQAGNAAVWLLVGLILLQLAGVYCIIAPVMDLFNRLPKF